MHEIIKFPLGRIPIEIQVEDDWTTANNNQPGKKISYFIPQWFMERLNLIVDNLNEITKSKLGRSIMNLEKGSDGHQGPD